MLLADVNVLVYAHRPDSDYHSEARGWLESAVDSNSHFCSTEFILASVYRIVTNPRIYKPPTSQREALDYLHDLQSAPNYLGLVPGKRCFRIFEQLLVETKIVGSRSTDAFIAALAIEHDCTLYSFDKDFARFPGLKWRVPE